MKSFSFYNYGLMLLSGMMAAFLLTAVPVQAQNTRPNVILILSDDMGYSDIGCFGGEAATPNLDKIAKEGLRYTQFYNMSRCCPSRAALISGLYPHNAGMGWMTTDDFKLPGYRGNLNDSCVTIAEALKTSGYATYMTGKWHLNSFPSKTGPKTTWPLQRGFDKYYGTILGAANYYDPGFLCRDNTLISPENDPAYTPKSYYFTDAVSDNSVKYIQERDKNKPFFMYVAYTAAHWPLQAPEEVIKKYKGRFDAGYDKLRQERLERMKKLGVIDPNTQLSKSDADSWAAETNKPAMLRRMETYAAMIDVMDQGVGRIMNELKKQGIDKNTVVIFLQDNGACAESVGSGQTKPVGGKVAAVAKPADEITYSNNPPVTRDGKPVMQGATVMAGPADTYVAYMKEWANVSNTPFRLYKHDAYEGGIATPMLIRWPDGIKKTGEVRKQVGHVIDILPTILDIAKVTYPKQYNSRYVAPVNGISMLPSFANQPVKREAIYFEHEMNKAIRMGKWKLVSENEMFRGQKFKAGPWALYDLENDRAEEHDLAAANPELVKKMSAMWLDYATKNHVFPAPWTEAK